MADAQGSRAQEKNSEEPQDSTSTEEGKGCGDHVTASDESKDQVETPTTNGVDSCTEENPPNATNGCGSVDEGNVVISRDCEDGRGDGTGDSEQQVAASSVGNQSDNSSSQQSDSATGDHDMHPLGNLTDSQTQSSISEAPTEQINSSSENSVDCNSQEMGISNQSNDTGIISEPHSKETSSSCVSSVEPSPNHSCSSGSSLSLENRPTCSITDSDSVTTDQSEDQLLYELDAELENNSQPGDLPNGVKQMISPDLLKDYKLMNRTLENFKAQLQERNLELQTSKEELTKQERLLQDTRRERDALKERLQNGTESSAEDVYIVQIKELEHTINKLEKENRVHREKLNSHDAAAKRAIASLQTELKAQVDKAKKIVEDSQKEKDNMVMKYAQAEAKNIELQDKMLKVEEKSREALKEKESVIGRFKILKTERDQAVAACDSKHNEVSGLKREIEKLRESMSSQEVKAKWHQNKLKAELDAHKETKQQLEDCRRKLKEAKEEAEQIRRDCQAMIRTYQESEEIKSNSLDLQLKEKEEELQLHMYERSDQEEMQRMLKQELENLKKKHQDFITENQTLKDKVTCLDTERSHQEASLEKYRETLQKQKADISSLREQVAALEQAGLDLKEEQEKTAELEQKLQELETSTKDMRTDMDNCAKRESEHLVFTQKISDKNAQLQSENLSLHSKVSELTEKCQELSTKLEEAECKCAELEKSLSEEKGLRAEETDLLSSKLSDKSRLVEELSIQVEDQKDENKTLKRKHQANTKDLTRQLQQLRRRLEVVENKGDMASMGSRTSSNGSLENQGSGASGAQLNNHTSHDSRESSQEPPAMQMEDEAPIVEVVEVDRQRLLEKIVKLQKSHARKSEKIEFMQEHIRQLVEELQKKNKVIQSYFLREEAGTIAPEAIDLNKQAASKTIQAEMSRKGGIMASLYSTHSRDGQMTLDLSLEINAKLQAVLEDTILKNITLKENLETLGAEIARLSQENRNMQLSMRK